MTARDLLDQHRDAVLRIAAEHGARNVRLFGSVVRGAERSDSDIDVLVSMDSGRSLLDLVALCEDLEELLGRKVDVVSDDGISPYLRAQIVEESVSL